MIKVILVGFWAGLIAMFSGFAVGHLRERQANRPSETVSIKTETRKTKEINVPKIRDGAVKGYVVVALSYVVDASVLEKTSLSPDAFVADEIFKYLYDDETIDFDHLDKFDLKKMTTSLVGNINRRVKADAISDIGIQEFTYMATPEGKPR